MEPMDKVLETIALKFNEHHLEWALGGSKMLALRGMDVTTRDLDLLVSEKDAEKASKILTSLGQRKPQPDAKNYVTRHFEVYDITGISVDLIAGFALVKEGVRHDLPLDMSSRKTIVELGHSVVPLDDLLTWERYYRLLGRPQVAKRIRDFLDRENDVTSK